MSYQGPDERYATQAAEGTRTGWGVLAGVGRAALAFIERGLDAMADRPIRGLGHAMMLAGVHDVAQPGFIRDQAAAVRVVHTERHPLRPSGPVQPVAEAPPGQVFAAEPTYPGEPTGPVGPVEYPGLPGGEA